jgi:hypothetical protein
MINKYPEDVTGAAEIRGDLREELTR